MPDKNYDTVRYGTSDGELKFGHIHDDGKISSFIVRSGHDPNHYMSMEAEGTDNRKGGTINRCTGAFQVKAGDNVLAEGKEENIAILLEALNGDIVINAVNGGIRIIGKNVEIKSTGSGDKGNINMVANERAIIKSKIVNITGSTSIKLESTRQIDLIAKTFMNIYGGMVDIADSTSTKRGSKTGKTTNQTNNSK